MLSADLNKRIFCFFVVHFLFRCGVTPGTTREKNRKEKISKIENLIEQFENKQKPLFDGTKGIPIIGYLTQIAHLNNQCVMCFPNDNRLKTVAVWFGCASGENRTGIMYFDLICTSKHIEQCVLPRVRGCEARIVNSLNPD